ncbi:hypothetical protein LUZ60_009055 [Juncus effusus]|nr:hypothetical protein LUZ60_009055 [Juncus effusus]
MEYERIHKVQVGVLSPTKLRMKLLNSHNRIKNGGAAISGTSSSRSSPSKNTEQELSKNSLLTRDSDEEESSRETRGSSTLNHQLKEIRNLSSNNVHKVTSNQSQMSNLSTIHPVRTLEEEGNGCNNNFEFHKGLERISQNPSFARPAPSKWNDAEKWVLNRQNSNSNSNSNALRRLVGLGQSNFINNSCANNNYNNNSNSCELRVVSRNMQGVETKRIDGASSTNNTILQSKASQSVPTISTRDFGTEMTPIPSQDPSRTCTPLDSITPIQISPNSSIPSTPFGEKVENLNPNLNPNSNLKRLGSMKELSDRELKIETRKEIAALGVQLGKIKIATWASKEEVEIGSNNLNNFEMDEIKNEEERKRDYVARAVAWQEAENLRHNARFKREEVKIQAWENHQRAKLETEIRKIEAKAERMRAKAIEKMSEKLQVTRQTAEEKRATAEALMNKHATKSAQKADQIRQTGRIPSSHRILCCNGFGSFRCF